MIEWALAPDPTALADPAQGAAALACYFQLHRIADRAVMMDNGNQGRDVSKHEMTAEALEHIVRDGEAAA